MRTELTWRGDEAIRAINGALDDAVTAGALVAADAAVAIMGRDHGGIPSKPGEPPNVQKGTLSRSTHYVSPQDMGIPHTAAAGTDIPYGRFLEYGTSRMAARPWLLRAALQSRAKINKVAAATFRQSLKRRLTGGTGGK